MLFILIWACILNFNLVVWSAPSLTQDSATFIVLQDQEPFYSPPTLTLTSGESVEWYNRSATEHTITHDQCGRGQFCAFNSGHLHPGERFSVASLPPGRYSYHCEIHPFMHGVIVVRSATPNFNATEL